MSWRFKAPRSIVENMRDGRYAVDFEGKWTFLRVSRPKHGALKGYFVVQTQHGESYAPLVTIGPSSAPITHQTPNARLENALLVAACDPFTSAISYGIELGCCSRCGRELTDERSRWYSIGPECEKSWPEIVNYIDETKGAHRA